MGVEVVSCLLALVHRDVVPLLHHALVCRADDLTGVDQFLDAVCAPSDDPCDREEGSEQLWRDSQHVVDESAVEVNVSADTGERVPPGTDEFRGHLLDVLVELEVLLTVLLDSEPLDQLPEDGCSGIGEGIDRVTHSVDETQLVECILVEDLDEVLLEGLLVAGVGTCSLMSAIISMTLMLAPPCFGPLSEDSAAAMTE